MRAPASIVITGASIARQEACAGDISTPTRASRIAGSKRSRQSRRPNRACSAPIPAGTPGTANDAGPDRVVDELLAERHLELDEVGALAGRAPRRSSRGSARSARPRPSRSRTRRRAGRSSPSRRHTRRAPRRPPHRPRCRRPRGSAPPPPPSRDSPQQSQVSCRVGYPRADRSLGRAPSSLAACWDSGDHTREGKT